MSRARTLADYVSSGDELALKAPIAGPTFTGTVAIPNVSNLETAVVANTAKVTNYNQTLADINALDVTELGTVTSANLANTAIVYPVGHVVQVTYNSEVDDYGFSATGGTWYTIITTVITPHNKGGSDSKILVLVDAPGLWIPSGTSHNYMRIQRAGSSITAGGDTGMYFGSAAYTSHWIIYNPSVAFMDSPSIPATPVAISYTFQIKMSVTGGVYVPNSHGNISITLMEIIQ